MAECTLAPTIVNKKDIDESHILSSFILIIFIFRTLEHWQTGRIISILFSRLKFVHGRTDKPDQRDDKLFKHTLKSKYKLKMMNSIYSHAYSQFTCSWLFHLNPYLSALTHYFSNPHIVDNTSKICSSIFAYKMFYLILWCR